MFFYPRIISTLKNYDKKTFFSDLMAGIIVGIVALPLAIAFGIASGVSPEKGIITAVIAGFIISLLGGSNVQIGGPTGAFIVIVYGIIAQYGESGLIVATLMAGVILLLLGILRLGTVIKFIPYPIVVGFTSGIALTIFATQIKDLFGLTIESVPADFLSKWVVYASHFDTIDLWSAGVGILSIVIIAITPRFSKTIPGSLVAIILMTVVAFFLREYAGVCSIETIGDRFSIQASLPQAEVPAISLSMIQSLLPAALTIAVLGAIESLLSATVADGVTGDKHNSNTELIAQGAANLITPLFGGIPATGAIARTMANINNGGKTPVAGLIHAVVLLLILVCLGPLTSLIPMSCLAGVLVIVAYNMRGWRTFRALFRSPKSDVIVLLVTFLLTVIFDLTVAIEVGVVIACLLFMRRIAETTNISVITDKIDPNEGTDVQTHEDKLIVPQGVEVYEINGPFFFGVANKFDELMSQMGEKPRIRIIRMRKIPFIDSTGLHNLEMLCHSSHKEQIQVLLSGVNPGVRATLEHAGLDRLIGSENIFDHIDKAIVRASELVRAYDQGAGPVHHRHL